MYMYMYINFAYTHCNTCMLTREYLQIVCVYNYMYTVLCTYIYNLVNYDNNYVFKTYIFIL